MKTFLLTLILLPLSLFAKDAPLPFELPQALLIKGKPIPPVCFNSFTALDDAKPSPLSLTDDPCLEKHIPYNQYALKQGFLGYELTPSSPHSMRLPSIFYRYIGTLSNNYVFELNHSGGGSGFFSSLQAFSLRKGSLTQVRTYDSGDRCFGGISNAEIINHQLSYQKNITPEALLNLFNKNRDEQAQYPDCAICCLGKLTIKNNTPISFTFNGTLVEQSPRDEALECFNQRLKNAGALNKSTLALDELKELVLEIEKTCILVIPQNAASELR